MEHWRDVLTANYVVNVPYVCDVPNVDLHGQIEALGNSIEKNNIMNVCNGSITGVVFDGPSHIPAVSCVINGSICDCRATDDILLFLDVRNSQLFWCKMLYVNKCEYTVFDNCIICNIMDASHCEFKQCKFVGGNGSFVNCKFENCTFGVGRGFATRLDKTTITSSIFMCNGPLAIIDRAFDVTMIDVKFHGTGARYLVEVSEGTLVMSMCEMTGVSFVAAFRQITGQFFVNGLILDAPVMPYFVESTSHATINVCGMTVRGSRMDAIFNVISGGSTLNLGNIVSDVPTFARSVTGSKLFIHTLTLDKCSVFLDQIQNSTVTVMHAKMTHPTFLLFLGNVYMSVLHGHALALTAENVQFARSIADTTKIKLTAVTVVADNVGEYDKDTTSEIIGDFEKK